MMKPLSLVLALCATTSLGIAQVGTSEVLGTVWDASHSAVATASVTLTSKETGISAKTTTDGNGEFDFLEVKVGHYTVTVEQVGFAKATADVAVDVEARQRVDINLQVGAVSDTVNVTGAAATLDTDNSEHSQVINTDAIVELPLNGRNYADLALLSTNAVKSPIAVSFSASGTPREASFNVNGMRSTYNDFLLDGVDNNSYGTRALRVGLTQRESNAGSSALRTFSNSWRPLTARR
jgi:hypothetical protein